MSVSVLFSEPKIPQCRRWRRARRAFGEFQCSSASRKFLNLRQKRATTTTRRVSVLFSEPKIPQSAQSMPSIPALRCFSALQRAENSSMRRPRPRAPARCGFQCSSASRKFLNPVDDCFCWSRIPFQCSSASRKFLNSVRSIRKRRAKPRVSVLFSEPKIPQFDRATLRSDNRAEFQCSSASRKFLNNVALRRY